MDGFEQETARRVPLAEAVFQSLRYLTDEAFLAEVFERHRGRSFELELSFATMVHLIGDALLEHSGSARRALVQARDASELPVTPEAFYAKLRRTPQSLSCGFLREAAQRLRGVLAPQASPVPASLAGFEVLAVDGKKIKHAAKRLKPARRFRGSVLGGKVLVALSLETGLAVAMSSDLDGECNDRPLVPGLLAQLQAVREPRPRLLVLDRQFCDLDLPALLTSDGDHFLIRHSRKVTFTRDESHPARHGTDPQGRGFTDERGWLGRAQDRRRRYVRRITLDRPGEDEVSVLTDLLDERSFPAVDLLAVYGQRWGIERVFQQITDVFHLKQLIASSPEGTIFQCAFCLIVYGLLQVQRSYLASARGVEPERISLENLFYDVRRQLTAWNELLPRAWTIDYFAEPSTASALTARLHALLDPLWKDAWWKAAKHQYRPKHLDPPQAGGHTSIYRLIRRSSGQ